MITSTLCVLQPILPAVFQRLIQGESIRQTLMALPIPGVSVRLLEKWENMDDRVVVGDTLSTACYLPESFVGSRITFCMEISRRLLHGHSR